MQRARRDEKVTVAGIVAALRERPTKTGKRMAWVTLEDLSGSRGAGVLPRQGRQPLGDGQGRQVGQGRPASPGYEHWEPLLKCDEPILVTGTVQINNRDEENPTAELIVEEIQSPQGGPREAGEAARAARCRADLVTEERLAQLAELAKKYAGATPRGGSRRSSRARPRRSSAAPRSRCR